MCVLNRAVKLEAVSLHCACFMHADSALSIALTVRLLLILRQQPQAAANVSGKWTEADACKDETNRQFWGRRFTFRTQVSPDAFTSQRGHESINQLHPGRAR